MIANVKGYVNQPNVIIPANKDGKLDVSGAIGPGFLNVIRDIGMKEPYNGQVHLVSGEIAEDLTYYYATSEQIPSSVGLGVLLDKENFVKQACGLRFPDPDHLKDDAAYPPVSFPALTEKSRNEYALRIPLLYQ